MEEKLEQSMTVGELKTLLKQYNNALPVMGEWEGLQIAIVDDCISTKQDNTTKRYFLNIDVNNY